MQFTQEEYERANQVDIAQYLMNQGITLKREGNIFRGVEHDSFVIKNNHWYWNSRRIDGYPVEYLTKVEGMDLPDAVHLLANGVVPATLTPIPHLKPFVPKEEKENVPFAPPPANADNRRVFAYLTRTRSIDPEIVNWCIKHGLVYQSNVPNPKTGKSIQNCVFTGLLDGKLVFATERGLFDVPGQKAYRHEVDGSREDCRFVMDGKSNRAIIVEAPIDAMSHATLFKQGGVDWKVDTRVALCGNCDVALEGFLNRNPNIRHLIWSVDNDRGGQIAIERYWQKYADRGYFQETDLPTTKDWNSDLVAGVPYFLPENDLGDTNEELEFG
jgi:hypothetical protein